MMATSKDAQDRAIFNQQLLLANMVNAEAQCSLGYSYDIGRGVTRDLKKAAELYQLAANQGHASAQSNLGWCYLRGRGVDKNISKAVTLFKQAADQADEWGQLNLGFCYENGQGVEKDLRKAAELYQLTATQREALKGFIEHNTAAADEGAVSLQVLLGLCYQEGLGVEKNPQLAYRYFEMAAEKGIETVQPRLEQLIRERAAPIPVTLTPSKTLQSQPISPKLDTSFHIPYGSLAFGTKLGEGGFGTVFAGEWHYNAVAIKTLNSQSLTTEALTELQEEAQIMARMKSDYIVTLRGICIQNPYVIVMELMPKGSLDKLLHNRQDLPWSIRYAIGKDIGFGLQQLHDNGIIHRDLKSLNVLLSDTLRAKICDFGLSQVKAQIGSQSQSKTVLGGKGGGTAGTVLWKAPELFKRGSKHSKASDTYSYGMVLWEIASRKFPYADEESQELVKDFIKDWEYENIPSDCPKQFAEAITSCWGEKQKPETRSKPAEVARGLLTLFEHSKAVQSRLAESPSTPLSSGYAQRSAGTTSSASPYQPASPSTSVSPENSGYQVRQSKPPASGYQLGSRS